MQNRKRLENLLRQRHRQELSSRLRSFMQTPLASTLVGDHPAAVAASSLVPRTVPASSRTARPHANKVTLAREKSARETRLAKQRRQQQRRQQQRRQQQQHRVNAGGRDVAGARASRPGSTGGLRSDYSRGEFDEEPSTTGSSVRSSGNSNSSGGRSSGDQFAQQVPIADPVTASTGDEAGFYGSYWPEDYGDDGRRRRGTRTRVWRQEASPPVARPHVASPSPPPVARSGVGARSKADVPIGLPSPNQEDNASLYLPIALPAEGGELCMSEAYLEWHQEDEDGGFGGERSGNDTHHDERLRRPRPPPRAPDAARNRASRPRSAVQRRPVRQQIAGSRSRPSDQAHGRSRQEWGGHSSSNREQPRSRAGAVRRGRPHSAGARGRS